MSKKNLKLKGDMLVEMRSDILFQDIFNIKNISLLTLLVSQLLEKSYEELEGKIEVKNVRLVRSSLKERQKYCDYVIKIDNLYIIIELNNNYLNIYTRNEIYAFSVINSAYGNDLSYYKEDIKVILFNLNWNYRSEDKKMNVKVTSSLPRTTIMDDYLFKMVNINLDYYVDKRYNEISDYEKLFKLFTCKSKKELIRETSGNTILERYRKEVLRVMRKEGYREMVLSDIMEANLDAMERETYARRSREEGIQEGIKEGIFQKEQEMVLNMYNDNVPLNTISKYASLTLNKVEEIISKSKK